MKNIPQISISRSVRGRLAAAISMLILSACAAVQPTPQQRADNIEPMLSAAGFRMLPADNQDKLSHLQTLPQLTVKYYSDNDGTVHYWMADADYCHCIYLGNETAFQQYRSMQFQQHLADQQQEAAEYQMEAAQQEQMELMNPFMGPMWIY